MQDKPRISSAVPEWRTSKEPVPYENALAEMEARVAAILDGHADELIWLLEHPALYTAGTRADGRELLDGSRFPIYQTGRGGKHTYHGPGQRVIYAMMNLAQRDRDLKAHVWRLEEWIIRVLSDFGVKSDRRQGRIGVWVTTQNGEEKKIAAIGVRARRWVTSHGLALNVETDLSHFAGIVPCGITGYGVTSLRELGIDVTMDDVDKAFKQHFKGVFG